MATATPPLKLNRITSLDQFRGYTVAGMFLVNFMGGVDAFPDILKHHNDYCSYSDTIMPQFLFAVGFAFRLSFGRRTKEQGIIAAYWHMVKRFIGLMLLAVVVYDAPRIESWKQLYNASLPWWQNVWFVIHDPVKRHWMETLAHIAITSLWILPVIRTPIFVRLTWMIGSAAAHVYISHKFPEVKNIFHSLAEQGNYIWVNTSPNGIDGGPFGFLTWTVPAIMGTIACDAIVNPSGIPKLGRLAIWSIVLMVLGYGMSCGTRLYDRPEAQIQELLKEREAIRALAPKKGETESPEAKASREAREAKLRAQQFPPDPVYPAKERWQGRSWMTLLAEPPLIGRPPNPQRDEWVKNRSDKGTVEERRARKDFPEDWYYRQWNYWMMSQRGGTLSYLTFAAGFSIAVYLVFYLLCDKMGLQIGIFRTFGVNALVGYVLHGMVGTAVKNFLPGDVPDWYAWCAVGVFMYITYIFLRYLERNKIYIKM
ncbi:MAG: heparan-alpha-glucosaminide N-acetyltransferase domain-containing protein [Planctomycetales bacterium]